MAGVSQSRTVTRHGCCSGVVRYEQRIARGACHTPVVSHGCAVALGECRNCLVRHDDRVAGAEYLGSLRHSLWADSLADSSVDGGLSASSTNVVEIVIASYESEVPQIFRLLIEHGIHHSFSTQA